MNASKIASALTITLSLISFSNAYAASRVTLPSGFEASAVCANCLRDQAASGNDSARALFQRINEFKNIPRTAQSNIGKDFAFAPIGKISSKESVTIVSPDGTKKSGFSNGTAFMVSPCHVLTNRHVVFGDAQASLNGYSTTFSIGNDGTGKPTHVVDAAPVIIPDDTEIGHDWTLLLLKSCLSDEKIGWMKLGNMEASQKVVSAGFPGDRNGLTSSKSCEVHTEMLNFLFSHDCATRPGNSGSPLFTVDSNGIPTAVGINTAQNRPVEGILPIFDEDHSNKATGLNQIIANPKIQKELQRGFDWYATKHPGQENPQIAMARQYRNTQVAQNSL